MFVAQNLGKCFIKLVQARDTELVEDITNYDGERTRLLDYYTVEDYEIVDFADIVDKVDSVKIVDTVSVHGSFYGEVRCYTDRASVLVLTDGTMWMDEALHDNIFC